MPNSSDNNTEITYRYTMGFAVGTSNPPGTALPDPSSFTGSESDLDTMGERDATGYLHRKKVATKHPIKLSWNGIQWSKIVEICQAVNHEKLYFTFPDPFSSNATRTIEAYVGDREFECRWAPDTGDWRGDLKFSVIEY